MSDKEEKMAEAIYSDLEELERELLQKLETVKKAKAEIKLAWSKKNGVELKYPQAAGNRILDLQNEEVKWKERLHEAAKILGFATSMQYADLIAEVSKMVNADEKRRMVNNVRTTLVNLVKDGKMMQKPTDDKRIDLFGLNTDTGK